ncbi:hypothetical protein BS21228_22575 (plasmid) [Bacillus subtilis]|nr:hypothetical protein BS21228_22575 [Bacillus subtilis]
MDQTKSESKLREYLDDNLSEEAKKKYEIYIFKEDIDKLKQEHQRVYRNKADRLRSAFLYQISYTTK